MPAMHDATRHCGMHFPWAGYHTKRWSVHISLSLSLSIYNVSGLYPNGVVMWQWITVHCVCVRARVCECACAHSCVLLRNYVLACCLLVYQLLGPGRIVLRCRLFYGPRLFFAFCDGSRHLLTYSLFRSALQIILDTETRNSRRISKTPFFRDGLGWKYSILSFCVLRCALRITCRRNIRPAPIH